MVTVEVKHADGIKCPRCWNYHTIQGNPLDVCDRCVVTVTDALDWLVAEGRWTQADADVGGATPIGTATLTPTTAGAITRRCFYEGRTRRV